MIKKIIHIKNYGKYHNFNSADSSWNGILNQTTGIYADNGSGKTTLTQAFKSLKGDNELIKKRKTFGESRDIDILFLNSQNKQFLYSSGYWNTHEDKIEVFDSFFVDSNVYLISLEMYHERGGFFGLIIGESGIKLVEEINQLRDSRRFRRESNRKLRQNLRKNPQRTGLMPKVEKNKTQITEINKSIKVKEKELVKVTEAFGKDYLEKINEYLRYFNPNLQLTKLNKKGAKLVYYIKFKDHEIRSTTSEKSLKHTLSEGDKSSLALSFFLAKISLLDNLGDRIIVFDDPISSFDSSRRNVTINHLVRLSKKVKQFILLSHDIGFVKEFSNRAENCLNLKISNNGSSSIIDLHNIEFETMTGIFKDLTVLNDYVEKGDSSGYDKREVIRCIRPALEGIFRIKYFKTTPRNEWLGDMIKRVRESSDGDKFEKLKPVLNDLIDINDYSKVYHHSNPNYLETPINSEELRNFILLTIETINKI